MLSDDSGFNSMNGSPGDDTMDGTGSLKGAGADLIDASGFGDTINGGEGGDAMLGSNGADDMSGGGGNDAMQAGNAADIMSGGAGHDRMRAQVSDDTIYAVEGERDRIFCSLEKDTVETDDVDFLDHCGVVTRL